jgi:3-hydroxybutyryl-CoA dehydrogenase
MTAIDPGSTVAVVGTGTMGQGIAQVALIAGHSVRLYDAAPGRAEHAARSIAARLDRLVDKGTLDAAGRDAACGRLSAAEKLVDLEGAELVVEAILEDLGAKQQVFSALETVVADSCLLATNTSSLPVTAVAGALRRPGRLVGLHFFNPAPLMPLVEVVSGHATEETAATAAYETVAAWGKVPVRAADTPGFIVNRVARPFYAEAFRLYQDRAADPATIDAVLRECGGFRMGPFELTDLIGQDVNEAVTRSVWQSFFHDPKFAPSLAQRRLVESGRLGRKTGRGWYVYEGKEGAGAERPLPRTAPPESPPAEVVLSGDLGPAEELNGMIREAGIKVSFSHEPSERHGAVLLPDGTRLGLTGGRMAAQEAPVRQILFDLALDYRAATRIALAPSNVVEPRSLAMAVGLFQALGMQVSVIEDTPGLIVARTVAMLVDLAANALAQGVASQPDIDKAMRLGVGYPMGPLEWGERLTARWVSDFLRGMHAECPDGRYAPSLLLRRCAATGRPLQYRSAVGQPFVG